MRHGSNIDPPNRFDRVHAERDLEQVEDDDEYLNGLDNRPIEYLADASRTIVAENDSPDVPFRYSVNPYRGCVHGCSYCFARPSHEYLGFSAGLDFETKIVVKHDAPALFRDWLNRRNWTPEVVILSGVTDCYQPIERKLRLARGCLEVAAEAGLPVSVITKNALVTRDLDILGEMARHRLAHVSISLTTLDAELARALEPRASVPAARLRAIAALNAAGVPVRVMAAPVVLGLNDSELPALLKAAADAGAGNAAFTLLRLPLAVAPVFLDWLRRNRPNEAGKVEALIRASRGGRLNDSRFGHRFHGEGERAAQVGETFKLFARRYGLARPLPEYDFRMFHPPKPTSGQLRLF